MSVTGRPSRLCVSRRPFSGGLQTFQDLREMGKVYTFDAKFPVVPHTARNHGIDPPTGFADGLSGVGRGTRAGPAGRRTRREPTPDQ